MAGSQSDLELPPEHAAPPDEGAADAQCAQAMRGHSMQAKPSRDWRH
jgi:hypothetical protein